MSSHKNNDLVILPLDEDNLLTQHERPGQRADANKIMNLISQYAESYLDSNHPFHPNSQGSNGMAHSQNPARFMNKEFNYISHRSDLEIKFHEALLIKNKKLELELGSNSTCIFGVNQVFIQKDRKRIEVDFTIHWQGKMLAIEIDGDIFHEKSSFDEEKRLKHLRDNFIDIRRIMPDRSNPNWATEAVEDSFNYLMRKQSAR
ncbi:hypothetical protein N9J91_00555 [Gammaproteobacteria bacterium]|nr:hypothetical protein [Gammaproteobacteria bacterium]